MHTAPRLVWSNPAPRPHDTLSPSLLRRLTDLLIGCVRRGEWQAARRLLALYAPSPFAIAVIAGRMSRAGIPEDAVLKLV